MFTYDTSITFRDSDAAGIVYFPRYFAMAHTAYEAFMEKAGLSFAQMLKDGEFILPVVHAEGDYTIPMLFGEKVVIRIEVEKIGNSSYQLHHEFVNDRGQVTAELRTIHVAVDMQTRQSIPLPEHLRAVLKTGMAD